MACQWAKFCESFATTETTERERDTEIAREREGENERENETKNERE